MIEQPAYIIEFLDSIFSYGTFWVYLVLFAACFIENLFPPFPGDSFVIAAGGLVALQRLDLTFAAVTILVGGISSVMLLYYFGAGYGRRYFEEKDYKYFSVKDIELMEIRLLKYGAMILVVSRFLVGIRSAVAVAAGVGRYPALNMFFYSTISYFLFTFVLMYLAIETVENFDIIMSFVEKYNLIVWPMMIIAVSSYILIKYLKFKREGE